MPNNIYITKLEERIKNISINSYFKEVISSFYNGNYRAAVTTLYSVVICDLVLKLHELKDRFNDKRAQGILADIEKRQINNPTSPEWEKILVEEMHKSHYIIDTAALTHIQALQNERNLCAHPVLKDSLELYIPNEDIVRGHIVNSLTDVLTKSSMDGNGKIYSHLIEDLEIHRDTFLKPNDVAKYLNSKYFNHINNTEEEFRIFKQLWKFVLFLKNPQADVNRTVNRWALYTILERHPKEIQERIIAEIGDFENRLNVEDKSIVNNLIKVFNLIPEVFKHISLDKQHLINAKLTYFNFNEVALFKVDDIESHILGLKKISITNSNYLIKFLCNSDNLQLAVEFALSQFSLCSCYNDADEVCEEIILTGLKNFSDLQLITLLKIINENSQIYERRKARANNREIKEEIESRNISVDWELYPNFRIY